MLCSTDPSPVTNTMAMPSRISRAFAANPRPESPGRLTSVTMAQFCEAFPHTSDLDWLTTSSAESAEAADSQAVLAFFGLTQPYVEQTVQHFENCGRAFDGPAYRGLGQRSFDVVLHNGATDHDGQHHRQGCRILNRQFGTAAETASLASSSIACRRCSIESIPHS